MKKILIIEDDLSLASAYRAKLSGQFETRNAVTGDEGIQLVFEWEPDLVLLDLFLPGKSGQEVLLEMKIDERSKNIPVIVLTNLEGQCEALLKQGAVDCAIKTEVTMEDIVKKIDVYLR